MRNWTFFIFLFAVAIFVGCTKEVQIDIPGYEQKLVIDGWIETDQPPIVLITRSNDIYAPTNLDAYLNSFVSGAIVTVSDGTNSIVLDEICTDNLPPGLEQIAAQTFGIPVNELANYHLCAYATFNPAFFGQVGKTYELTVEFEGKTYTSSTSILAPVALDSLYSKPEGGNSIYSFCWAKMTEPAGLGGGYFWEAQRINIDPTTGEPIDSDFVPTFSPVFDDQFIDGQTFEFAYENPKAFGPGISDDERGLYKSGDSVVIKFSTLDPRSYTFLEQKYVQLQTTGNPFASPQNAISNISGGCLGSWIGYAPVYDTVVILP